MSSATLEVAAARPQVIVDFANMFTAKATKNVCSRVPLENMKTQTDTVEPAAIPVLTVQWILIDAPIAPKVMFPMDRAYVNDSVNLGSMLMKLRINVEHATEVAADAVASFHINANRVLEITI